MLKKESVEVTNTFAKSAKQEVDKYLNEFDMSACEQAADMIKKAQENGGRIHITGIGKPGHVAEYMASLFSSTGNPCCFLHGTEAVHGSCGQLMEGDVVIAISNSGNTSELQSTVIAVKNNGCKVIGVTGNMESWLAKESDICLFAGVAEEGGPLNRAPRNSILIETILLQALSVMLQSEKDWDPKKYVRCHPGGALGQLRANEQ